MLRIQTALRDFLGERLPGVAVEKHFTGKVDFETAGDAPFVRVIPTIVSSGFGGPAGKLAQTSRGSWREEHAFEVIFYQRLTGMDALPMAIVKACKILPLFNRLVLSVADAECIEASRPLLYCARHLQKHMFYVSTHHVTFRRDYGMENR